MRASESPRIVERMWPTCIGFATFGDEKSTTSLRAATSGVPSRSSAASAERCALIVAGFRRKLMNPAPAISGVSHRSSTCSFAMISVASWRGFARRGLASCMATFDW